MGIRGELEAFSVASGNLIAGNHIELDFDASGFATALRLVDMGPVTSTSAGLLNALGHSVVGMHRTAPACFKHLLNYPREQPGLVLLIASKMCDETATILVSHSGSWPLLSAQVL